MQTHNLHTDIYTQTHKHLRIHAHTDTYKFYLENLGQGHGVGLQHSQRYHSMANVNIFKSHTLAFFASSHRFRDSHISIFVTLKM